MMAYPLSTGLDYTGNVTLLIGWLLALSTLFSPSAVIQFAK